MSDITVRIKADAGPLKRGMDDGARSVRGFSRDTDEMAKRVAKAGAVVVTAVAAIGAGVLKMASEAAKVGVEIKNLSAVAGTSTDNFQRMAAASRTVGVEQEKLSDILKDVNDKFGDFQATGAGPLADFFENIAPKIGVTADQFANLAGPDALQLYVDSLEKAGVSQQQMTFYLEALASDTTRLLPLLQNGGYEMARLGDEAARLGLILSKETIDGAVQLDRELAVLSKTLQVKATAAVMEYKDEIITLINFITDTLIPSIGGFLQWVNEGVEGWQILGRAAADTAAQIRGALNAQAESNLVGRPEGQAMSPELAALLGVGGGGGSEMPAFPNPLEGAQGPQSPEEFLATRPTNMTMGGPLDAAGGLLPPVSAADAARMAWEKMQEVQEEIRSGTASHEADLTRIEEDAKRDRERLAQAEVDFKKQAMATLYNDLTSLMSSENDKLFKIGKVAAIAEATVSGYNSAVKAYEGGLRVSGGNPAIGAAFAAASLAKTGALISQIASTSKSGGGRGSGGGGGSGAAASSGGGQAEQPGTTFAFTIQNDPMGFGESFARQMIEQLNASQRNGGRIQGVIT